MPPCNHHNRSYAALAMKTKYISKGAPYSVKRIGKESVNSCVNKNKSQTINVNSRKFCS